jgi:hypothetical protein
MNLRATVISPLCITRPGAFHGNIVTASVQEKKYVHLDIEYTAREVRH